LARCPFHDDHDPSMSVDFAKGVYHCFGCKTGGDIFQWVMRRRQMSFLEAMAWLAEEFNIEPQG
jgi:DNA primase